MNALRERAEETSQKGGSTIAAGTENEIPMATWKADGFHVRHLPDDEQGILRISIGGGNHLPVPLNYCSIRGPVGRCIELLENAIKALKASPD